jgi:hypothetical protein
MVQITLRLDLKTDSSTPTDNSTPTDGSTPNPIENRDNTASQSDISDPPDLLKDERINLALKALQDDKNLALHAAARIFGVPHSTF